MIAVIGKGHEDYQEICGVRIISWTGKSLRKQYGSWRKRAEMEIQIP